MVTHLCCDHAWSCLTWLLRANALALHHQYSARASLKTQTAKVKNGHNTDPSARQALHCVELFKVPGGADSRTDLYGTPVFEQRQRSDINNKLSNTNRTLQLTVWWLNFFFFKRSKKNHNAILYFFILIQLLIIESLIDNWLSDWHRTRQTSNNSLNSWTVILSLFIMNKTKSQSCKCNATINSSHR